MKKKARGSGLDIFQDLSLNRSEVNREATMATAIKTNPVNWFEIPVKDIGRARTFYEKVFGLELTPQEMGPYTMTFFPWTEGAPGAAGSRSGRRAG